MRVSRWPQEQGPTSKMRAEPQPGHRPQQVQHETLQALQLAWSAICRPDARRRPHAGHRPQAGQASRVEAYTALQPPQ